MATPEKNPHVYGASDRSCYLSSDGQFYCYRFYDADLDRMVTKRYEIGKNGLTTEIAQFLAESDQEQARNERRQLELHDPLFDKRLDMYQRALAGERTDPWNDLAVSTLDEHDREEPQTQGSDSFSIDQIRAIVDTQFTESQKYLFYEHFGKRRTLEDLRQEEGLLTGKAPTPQAMTNRKNKMLSKAAKALGGERVKRRKTSGKNADKGG